MSEEKTVLIVDDERLFRVMLSDVLDEGYRIMEADSGEKALAFIAEALPDLILMDIEMPGINGIEACRRLKGASATRHIPIILLTSHQKKESLIKGLKAGADDYIVKPVCLPEVVARVDAHLRSREYYNDLEHRDLLFLLELSENIFATRNPMTILRLIVERFPEIVDIDRCSFVGLGEQGQLVVKAGNDLEFGKEIEIDLARYPEIGKALETKRPVLVEDVASDPLMDPVRHYIENLGFGSIVVIPIIKKESVIGTFFLRTASAPGKTPSQRVFKLSQLIANLSANALENAILFESLKTAQEHFEEMSIRDGLTRLYNHRHFFTRLNHEFSRASRYGMPLSLVFFDIDDFKDINDAYGHQKGDVVLRRVGQIIHDLARKSDVGARYGGDEFAVLLPNTGADGGYEMANRLHRSIRTQQFDFLGERQVTASVGVATFDGGPDFPAEKLVSLADQAMYKSKSAGKDRISRVI